MLTCKFSLILFGLGVIGISFDGFLGGCSADVGDKPIDKTVPVPQEQRVFDCDGCGTKCRIVPDKGGHGVNTGRTKNKCCGNHKCVYAIGQSASYCDSLPLGVRCRKNEDCCDDLCAPKVIGAKEKYCIREEDVPTNNSPGKCTVNGVNCGGPNDDVCCTGSCKSFNGGRLKKCNCVNFHEDAGACKTDSDCCQSHGFTYVCKDGKCRGTHWTL